MNLVPIQVEAVYKALFYVLRSEKEPISSDHEAMYEAIIAHSPIETDLGDVQHLLEACYDYLKEQKDYLVQQQEEDD